MTDALDQWLASRITGMLDAQPVGSAAWNDVLRRSRREGNVAGAFGRRRLVLALVGAATCALLLALGLALHGAGTAGVATAQAACRGSGVPAAPCLRSLARLAEGRGAPPAIVYERSLSYRAAVLVPPGVKSDLPFARTLTSAKRPFTANEVQTIETWIRRTTRAGTRRVGAGRLVFPSAADRRAWEAAGSPTWKQMTTAPLDRAASERYRITGERIEDPLLAPDERATLLSAEAHGRDAHLLGAMRDPLGRAGVAISELYDPAKGPSYPWRWVYVYDPRTSRLLAGGVWPSDRSPKTSGWRGAVAYTVFAAGPRAAARVPDPR